MTKLNVTEGPWMARGEEVGYISKHDDQSFGMFCPIATTCNENDAHLIAVAPQLYEQLRVSNRQLVMEFGISHPLVVENWKVLAKARGES